MSKSRLILTLIIGVSAMAFAGCDNVLDENIVSGITADAQYTSRSGIQSAVNAAYEPLRDFYGDEQGGNLTQYGTDESTNAGHGSYRFMNFYDAGLNADTDAFSDIWSNFYRAINIANVVIGRTDAIDEMSATEKSSTIAEARFLRAHYYFYLVQYFGDVHLTLEETIGVEVEARRDPASEVYDTIISDLEFAIANLPSTQSDYGRVTKPAAEHMLAQVLLTRGYQSFGASDDFSRAATLAEGVINNYGFALVDDYGEVFNHDAEQNSEVVWSVQYSQNQLVNGEGNRTHLYFRPWYENINGGVQRTGDPGYGRPWIRFRITTWALENFRPLDVDSRYNKIFQTEWYYNQLGADRGLLPEGTQVGDLAIITPAGDLTPEEEQALRDQNPPGLEVVDWYRRDGSYINMFPSLMKHDDFKRGDNINETRGSRDFMVYRLAETHLLAAEAYLQSGDAAKAADHLNVVRRRAAWPGQEAAIEISAGDVDIDFILDERTRELYGEYKRWIDLKRTGKLIERVKAYNPEAAGIDQHHLLRPIPTNQILRSSGGYGQNPGY